MCLEMLKRFEVKSRQGGCIFGASLGGKITDPVNKAQSLFDYAKLGFHGKCP